jgi:UDP-N-acetylglucosamine transferase subunit ALG13
VILATVGTQLPFPRLLRVLDRIAAEHGLKIVAQTCGNLADARALDQREFLAPSEFAVLAASARVIVGHAGIGTIFAAARLEKPLILFPRRAALGEHRNDHQQATAAAMADRTGIHIAWDDADLERLLLARDLAPLVTASSPSRERLVATIAEFVGGSAR